MKSVLARNTVKNKNNWIIRGGVYNSLQWKKDNVIRRGFCITTPASVRGMKNTAICISDSQPFEQKSYNIFFLLFTGHKYLISLWWHYALLRFREEPILSTTTKYKIRLISNIFNTRYLVNIIIRSEKAR